MNQLQTIYTTAKALYDTTMDAIKKYLDNHQEYQQAKLIAYDRGKIDTEESNKAGLFICEIKIEADKKYDQSSIAQALFASEQLLLAEFKQFITAQPGCTKQVHELFESEKFQKLNVSKRQQLIDIAMRPGW